MAITDLIPWKKEETRVPVRRSREEEPFLDLKRGVDRLYDDFFSRPFGLWPFFDEPGFMGNLAPHIDMSESDKEITISAELPGMEPEDIHVTLDRNTLTISGEKRAEKEEQGKRFYRLERSYGSFYRSIPLPDEVDEDKIDATFRRGVLKIKLPKTAQAQKRSKRITVKTN